MELTFPSLDLYQPPPPEKLKEAEQNLEKAKELRKEKKYEEAVDLLSGVSEVMRDTYGDKTSETAEAYFYYVKKAIDEKASEISEAEGPGDDDDEDDNEEEKKADVEAKEEEKKEEKKEDGEDKAGDNKEEKKEEEEVDGMQLAWEVLEVARLALETEGDTKWQLMLSDVHATLSNIAAEQDNVPLALEEYKKAVTVKENCLEENDRRLAEVYYLYACTLASVNDKQMQNQSKSYFEKCAATLDAHLASLSETAPTRQEVSDLIKEVKDQDFELPDGVESMLKDSPFSKPEEKSPSKPSGEAPVTLVPRKRSAPPAGEASGEPETKKTKTE